jgi:hypothetical protein
MRAVWQGMPVRLVLIMAALSLSLCLSVSLSLSLSTHRQNGPPQVAVKALRKALSKRVGMVKLQVAKLAEGYRFSMLT